MLVLPRIIATFLRCCVWPQGARQPQAEPAHDGSSGSQKRTGDFTETLASFMAGGIEAAMPDLAAPGARPEQAPDGALLSPEPTAGCHVSAAPPSVAGSVPGSSGAHLSNLILSIWNPVMSPVS